MPAMKLLTLLPTSAQLLDLQVDMTKTTILSGSQRTLPLIMLEVSPQESNNPSTHTEK